MDKGIKRQTIFLLLLFAFTNVCRSAVVINEIMQSNLWEVMDDLDEFPDSYVELYNDGDEAITISGWRIGEKKIFENCYELPPLSIGAKEFQLVYCDKAERGIHTDFRLDSGKGSIYLFDEKGELQSSLSFAKQPAPNIAYGRETDGAEKWGYMLTPTPGKSNKGGITDSIAPVVDFSVPGGIWTEGTREPFYVKLNVANEEKLRKEGEDIIDTVVRIDTIVAWDTIVKIDSIEYEGDILVMYDSVFVADTTYRMDTVVNILPYFAIRYTTDGREPTEESEMYSGELYVDSSVAIKAKAFVRGYVVRPASVASYIWHPRDVHMAAVSLVTDPEYFYGEKGLYTLNSQMWVSSKVRRPMNFEYFPLEGRSGQKALNQICEGNVAGYTSAFSCDLKTLTLRANKRFGNNYFTNSFWVERRPNVKEVKSMKIRACNQIGDGILEPCVLNAMSLAGIDQQNSDNVVVYLNGKRYGFMYMQEPKGDDYFEAVYGSEDVDVIKYVGQRMIVNNGTTDEYNRFRDFYQTAHTLDEWKEYIDLELFTKYFVIEAFLANIDFFTNNMEFSRFQDSLAVWKPFLFDVESSFWHIQDGDYLQWSVEDDTLFGGFHYTDNDGTVLWRNLLGSDGFAENYLRYAIAMHGDYMNAEGLIVHYDSLRNEVYEELCDNAAQYKFDFDLLFQYYMQEERINQRNDYWPIDLQHFFKLGDKVRVVVNPDGRCDIHLSYDSVPLVHSYFDGVDYVGRNLTVSAKIDGKAQNDTIMWMRTIKYEEEVVIGLSKGEEISMVVPKGAKEIVLDPVCSGDGEECIAIIESEKMKFWNAENVMIADLLGRVVYEGKPRELKRLRKGIYVVMADGEACKVMVK